MSSALPANCAPWLNNMNRFLTSTIIFLVLLSAVITLVAWPALDEIGIIRSQVYDERVRLEKLYVRGQLQKKVRENYARIKDDVKFLDEIFLREHQELTYITALEQAGAAANIELKINIGETKRTPQQLLSTLGFSFEIKGAWPNIMRWLDAVEQIPYYTDIKEMAVAVHDEQPNGQPRTATVNISADTYWLVE